MAKGLQMAAGGRPECPWAQCISPDRGATRCFADVPRAQVLSGLSSLARGRGHDCGMCERAGRLDEGV